MKRALKKELFTVQKLISRMKKRVGKSPLNSHSLRFPKNRYRRNRKSVVEKMLASAISILSEKGIGLLKINPYCDSIKGLGIMVS